MNERAIRRPGGGMKSVRAVHASRRRSLGSLILICALALAAASGALALPERGAIEGRVVTHDGDPAAGARVYVVETRRVLLADEEGRFFLDGLLPGLYHLELASPRHGSGVAEIDVEAGARARVEVELHLDIHREEIVVSATPDPRRAERVYQPVEVLDRSELAVRMQPTLGETLDGELGVSSTYFGPGASRPLLRGLGADRSRVLEGGVGTGDVSGLSPDHAVSIDPLSAERVEIVRGPATLLYGSGALGGVVNVIDQRVPTRVSERPIAGNVQLGLGSVADERYGALSLGGGGGGFAWHVGATARETDDYEIPGPAEAEHGEEHGHGHEGEVDGEEHEEGESGVLENSALEAETLTAGVSRIFDRGYVGLAVTRFDTLYGVPGHAHGHEHGEEGEPLGVRRVLAAEEEEERVSIDLEQRRFDLHGQLDPESGFFRSLRLRAGTSDYEHNELEGSEIGTRYLSDGWEARVEGLHRALGAFEGSFGLHFGRTDLEAFGEEAFIAPATTENAALFLFEELERGPWRLLAGARYERQSVDGSVEGTSLSRDFSGLSASLGLGREIAPGYTATLTLSRAVRLPSAEELYSFGEHAATRSFEVGNPNLDEEVGLGVDLGFRYRGERISGELNLFSTAFSDFIYEAPGSVPGLVADLPVYVYQQDDARFLGAELHLDVELFHTAGHRLALDLATDWVRAERARDGEPLPFIPPLSTRVGLHYRGERFFGLLEAERQEEQERVFCEAGLDEELCESATEGFTMVNASVGVRFVGGSLVHELMLRGRNLTDRLARLHTSRIKDLVPLPGRDLSLVYRLEF